jgi:uncharacterized membrane protein
MKKKPRMNKRGLRVFKHPLHPALTHFPIALLSLVPVWDFLGLFLGEPFWFSVAFINIAAGLVLAVAAMTAGLIDYLALPAKSPAEKTAFWHMLTTLTGAALFFLSIVFRNNLTNALHGLSLYCALGFSLLGVVFIFVGGWLGGELVFTHKVGIEEK